MKAERLLHVDGLRAVAIAAVLLYHLGVPQVPSGFIGVDIFLVISGYLITRNIRQGLRQGNFSLVRFYRGRVMRLMPALVVTVFCTTIVAALIMTSQNAEDYGQSAVSALLAYSNYYFLSHVAYFDAVAETKPLLHTWSLSVEWQFYALWPLALIGLTGRFGERRAVPLLLLLAVASIAANVAWASETATTFYSTPFRVFEFAIGALAVWLDGVAFFRKLPTACLAAGLGAVIVPMLVPDVSGATPLHYGLLPCLGAALVILAGGHSPVGVVLANRMAVFLGRISYSTYLVHWPLITLYTYLMFRKPLPLEALALGGCSLVLGALLYRWVELPFWKGSLAGWSGWTLPTFLKLGAVALVVLPALDIARTGWPWRLPQEARSLETPIYGGEGFDANRVIMLGKGPPLFIIAGDSHALQFAHGLDLMLRGKGMGAIGLFDHGCLIAPDLTRYGTNANDQQECTAEYKRLKQLISEHDLPLIMAFNWPGYRTVIGPPGSQALQFADDVSYRNFLAGKLGEIRADAGHRRFAIVGTVPGSGDLASAGGCLQRPILAQGYCRALLTMPLERAAGHGLNLFLKTRSTSLNIDYIDLYPVFCPAKACLSSLGRRDLYSDRSHLSKNGSEVAAAEILRYVLFHD